MGDIYTITLVGFFVGVAGTGLGGLFAPFIKEENQKLLSCLLGLTGGLMLSIVAFELLPQSYILGGIITEIIGILLGIIVVISVEEITVGKDYNELMKSGIILSISMGIHNLPEGLAIGSSFMAHKEMGITLALAILVHNIPEGLALVAPLKAGKLPNWKIILIALIVGVPTGVGAFIGAYLGTVSNYLISFCLSFAGGTMLYIICNDLIPNAKTLHSGRASTIWIIIGFILGMLTIF
ncbi:ZIP family metal transporter [Anaerosalibacter bizertensis]|uniref:ZIP family metal transporter n=1 Tax=Anaerosalibacter bizertensis TaxID=932217 RepID=UPI001D00DD9F|nr:ZIP family metal transporter [Anaerosalibacter bizertensis]MCB5559751.1 ZIP family metal transporter [Anaerosalibacter bizertensis]